jgi:hypothetical protein
LQQIALVCGLLVEKGAPKGGTWSEFLEDTKLLEPHELWPDECELFNFQCLFYILGVGGVVGQVVHIHICDDIDGLADMMCGKEKTSVFRTVHMMF